MNMRPLPATILVAGSLLILPASATAHTGIKSFSPKRGSAVSRSLESVRVTFEGRIAGGSLSVRTARGTQVSRGRGSVVSRGRQIRARLNGGLRAGRYSASVRWVSGDGHVQTKSWTFRLR